MIVALTADGVSVSHDNFTYLSDVMLPTWEPRPRWAFGIGGGAVAGAGTIQIDDWRLSSAYLNSLHTTSLRVSFGPGQAATSPLGFDYYRPPVLSAIYPSSGPTAGGTQLQLSGIFLSASPHPTVRLEGLSDVPANASSSSLLLSVSPGMGSLAPSPGMGSLAPSSARQLFLSFNGQQFHSMSSRFYYNLPDAVSSVHPTGGPTSGGTVVSVHGRISSTGLTRRCRFSSGATPTATVEGTVTGSLLRCSAPAWPNEVTISVRISSNGQQYSPSNTSATFSYFDSPQIDALVPSASFSSGGGAVQLRGPSLAPFATQPLYCRFGDKVVSAINLSCAIPPDDAAGAGGELTDTDLSLYGAARRDSGVVRLTDRLPTARAEAGPGSVGYALASISPPLHDPPHQIFRSIRVSFQLLLDSAGIGASLSYGNFPATEAALLAESGGGAGLRLLFVTSPLRKLEVLYASERLATCTLHARPANGPGGAWHEVEVQYRSPHGGTDELSAPAAPFLSGLLVRVDGVTCISSLLLSNWAAQTGWRVGFGARSGTAPARHWLRALRIQLGARVGLTTSPLAVSANLQQWSPPFHFAYHPEPRISAINPQTGPRAGGSILTVLGSHLHGTQHRCRFGAGVASPSIATPALVDASYRPTDGSVLCEVPVLDVPFEWSVAHVSLMSNGQQYSADSTPFTFFDDTVSAVHRLLPASGAVDGGSLLRLPLVGLNGTSAAAVRADGRASCVFNGTAVAASISSNGGEVRCMNPPLAAVGDAEIRISLNGQQLLESLFDPTSPSFVFGAGTPTLFHLFVEPEVDGLYPSEGPGDGDSPVALSLYPSVPLAAGSNVTCRFGEAAVSGALLASTLHATAPSLLFPPRRLGAVTAKGALGTAGTFWAERFSANGLPLGMLGGVQVDLEQIDGGGQWFYLGNGTCVGIGSPNMACDAEQFVCTGPGGVQYGNIDEQVLAVVAAVLSGGGVHSGCRV